jgi:drug/metabolite transporter (DMT)-like permease
MPLEVPAVFYLARFPPIETMTPVNKLTAVAILLIAAIFEAGGDALVRMGLRQQTGALRWMTFLGGAAVLFAYGLTVNAPDWDFGRLLGLYVVFFFVTAQFMSWVIFHQPPSSTTLLGGALIVCGGIVLGLANA